MKVLAIDDQPEVLKEIEKAVASTRGPDGKLYDVVSLTSHVEALKRLKKERFDVVIADMVMGPKEDEGLAILRKLTEGSAITIVLTQHASIPNCVAAMQAGAWDYIEKAPAGTSDPYENLLESIQKACSVRLANPEAGRSNADARWVHEHLAKLTQQYAGEVVAVLDQRVVDHDKIYARLLKRLKDKFPVARPAIVSLPEPKVEAIE
ncbi:MAG: response regulator [Planctomycetes bacterium]|nr:response regulator [Planctomycetota bacterium]